MGTNRTGLKSFDRLAKDPRIKEIWNEGKDGYWLSLVPGYRIYDGTSGIHGYTVKEVLDQISNIEPGDPF